MSSFTYKVTIICLILSKSGGGESSWLHFFTSFIEVVDPVEERGSVTGRKSKPLAFDNSWPGSSDLTMSIPCLLMSCRSRAGRAEISEQKSMNAQGNKLQLWGLKEWLIQFQNRHQWNLLLGCVPYNFWVEADVEQKFRRWAQEPVQVQAGRSRKGGELCPVPPLCPYRGWMSPRSSSWAPWHRPQRCSPLEGDAFPLPLLKTGIFIHVENASLWKLAGILDFERENNLWNGNRYFHFWPFVWIFLSVF